MAKEQEKKIIGTKTLILSALFGLNIWQSEDYLTGLIAFLILMISFSVFAVLEIFQLENRPGWFLLLTMILLVNFFWSIGVLRGSI